MGTWQRPDRATMGLGLVVVALAGVWLLDIRRPWVGAHDWNGAAWSSAAWNIRRAGWKATAGAASLSHGPLPLPAQSFYVHHPPLVVWLSTAAFALFGEREWACRLVPVLFSLGTLLVIGWLLRQAVGPGVSCWGAAWFALTPAVLYYGKMPNHEALAVFGMTAAAASFWYSCEKKSDFGGALGTAALVLACLSGWGAYLFAAALCAAMWLDPEPAPRRLLAVAGAALVGLVVFLGQIAAVRPEDGIRDLAAAFLNRSAAEGIAPADWLARVCGHASRLLSPVGIGVAVAFAGWRRTLRSAAAPLRLVRLVLVPMFAAGIGNVVIFREGSFTHEYYCYYLTVPIALCFGLFVAYLRGDSQRSVWSEPRARAVAVCLSLALAIHGLSVWQELRSQQSMFFAGPPEPRHFVVELGRLIQRHFPPDVAVLTDALDHGPQLGYYARRQIRHPASGAFFAEPDIPFTAGVGGLIYLGYPAERQFWQSLQRTAGARFRLATVRLADHEFGLVLPPATDSPEK